MPPALGLKQVQPGALEQSKWVERDLYKLSQMLNGCTRQNNPADGGTSQILENVHGHRSEVRNFFQNDSCFPFFLVLERETEFHCMGSLIRAQTPHVLQ